MKILALKFSVADKLSYSQGLPRIMEILESGGATASFFFGMGTESTGGLRERFSSSPFIVDEPPLLIREAAAAGFECGLYGWNPKEWETRLARIRDTTLEADIHRALERFTRGTGIRPAGFASPGWQATYMSLRVLEEVKFKYLSDSFGIFPYLPKLSWKTYKTPQIPETLPPFEWVIRQESPLPAGERLMNIASSLPRGLSVFSADASLAASLESRSLLRDFIGFCRENDVKFTTLSAVADSLDRSSLPVHEIIYETPPGFKRPVATQSLAAEH